MVENAGPAGQSGSGRVTVVVPFFNVAPWLDRCLESLRTQSYQDIEVVCVDDGSTDGSADVARRHQETDGRLRVHTQPNLGPGSARNKGMDLASPESRFVMFVDGDDWIDALMVEKLARRATEVGADVVCCGGYAYNHQSREAGLWQLPETLYAPSRFRVVDHPYVLASTSPWAKLFDLRFLRAEAIRFPEDLYFEDIPFVYMAMLRAESVSILNERLYYYRLNRPGAAINTYQGQRHLEAFEMLSRIEAFLVENDLQDAIGPVFARYKTSHLLMGLRAVWTSPEFPRVEREQFLGQTAATVASMRAADFDHAADRHTRADRWLLKAARRRHLAALRLMLRVLPVALPRRIRERSLGLPR